MSRRGLASSILAAGAAVFCGYWAWTLLASSDVLVVLEGRIRLPLPGLGIPAGAFFIAAPLAGTALVLWARSRGRLVFPLSAAFPAVLVLNALRCLQLHDPVLSYVGAGLALAGTVLTAGTWLVTRPFRKGRAFSRNIPVLAGIAATVGLEAAAVFFLVPWGLRGSLPKGWDNYPFGPAMRRLVFADLAGAVWTPGAGRRSLRGIRLEGADLNGAILEGADLREARFFKARLFKADLDRADLRGALFTEAGLSFASLRDADLTGAVLNGIYSMGVDLRGATLKGISHHVQRLFYADCRGADFSSAQMNSAQHYGADFRETVFRDARLPGAFLVWARFDDADLSRADLSKADVEKASFRGAILDGADLRGALHLTAGALAEARSLRSALLDPPLLEELKRLGLSGMLSP